MEFFRNPEIKQSFILYILITAVVSCIGFFIGFLCGVFSIITCLIFIAMFFLITLSRYKKIAELSRQIDQILHGSEVICFKSYNEGELAVLQNEISKMTIKLREQTDSLFNDKTYLTDSIADISHQLRTPLTSINLIITFLTKPELTYERRLQLTKELERLTSKIDFLISSLLKLSKIDSGTANFKSEKVLVSDVIEKAFAPIAIPMEVREQQFFVDAKGDESFLGDLAWTVEAIENIIKNCMEHTPIGGKIDIACLENAIYTELIISDNGIGISEEDLPHLFERFYKGKDAGEQSIGIGLALTRMIITEQNGTIKAENIKDGGARFIIRFYKSVV